MYRIRYKKNFIIYIIQYTILYITCMYCILKNLIDEKTYFDKCTFDITCTVKNIYNT